MNKKLLFILCFFSFFFFGMNVKASEEQLIDYTNVFNEFKENDYNNSYGLISDNVKDAILEIEQVLDESGMNYVFFVQNFYTDSGAFGISVREYVSNEVNLNVERASSTMYNFRGNKSYVGSSYLTSSSLLNTSGSDFLKFINYIKENKHLPSDNGTMVGWIPLESGNNVLRDFIYSTNMTIKLNNINTFSGLKIGDTIYKTGDKFPTYKEYIGSINKYYSFTENINTLGKSQVRFRFDIPKNKMFTFELNHSVTYPIGYDSAPYLEVISSNRKTILPLEQKYNDLEQTIYYDTQINNFASNVQEVNLVVDLEWLSGKDENVLVHFDSEYPFTYEYVSNSSYIEVDWTGKYGIMLLPKLSTNVEHYYDIYSDVFFKGNYLTMKIFPDNNTNINALEEHVFKGYDDLFGGYKYYFHSDYNKYKMFFVNPYYQDEPSSTILKYDSRYFVHSLCSDKYTCEVIKNPNDVNDDVNVKPPDPFLSDEHENGNEIVDKILGFIYNKLPIIKQIPDIWGVFLQGMREPKPPEWVVDLTSIGFNIQVKMDFTIFDEYRDMIFFIIKVSASYVTLKKVLDILLKYFND